jgi:hypothetical protein
MDNTLVWIGIMVIVGFGVWIAAPYHHGMVDRRSDGDDSPPSRSS